MNGVTEHRFVERDGVRVELLFYPGGDIYVRSIAPEFEVGGYIMRGLLGSLARIWRLESRERQLERYINRAVKRAKQKARYAPEIAKFNGPESPPS